MIMAVAATCPSPTRLLCSLASSPGKFASPSSPLSPRSSAAAVVKEELLIASIGGGGDGDPGMKSPAPPASLLKRKRPPRLAIPASERESSTAEECVDDEYSDLTHAGHGYGVACKKGRRQIMEDSFTALPKQGFFGVFDGHGGRAAARFAARNLLDNIVKAACPTDEAGAMQIGAQEIRMGYHTTDDEFLRQGSSSGASCVSALIARNELIVANAGDCRALLVKSGGAAIQLTQDHRFSSESERRRVESLGGIVDRYTGTWRVQGVLAVSRGIGDIHLKEFISCDPHVVSLPLTSDCEFLILASDGLWDLVSNQEAAECALLALKVGAKRESIQLDSRGAASTPGLSSLGAACRRLVDLTLKRGCLDDVTVMIVELGKFSTPERSS
ncbi:probable protein phosphatase 2C 32 [Selaginella moellendorffii]|uniref:probable protein phosphatase 2C 32 n=1 Tax=Selaginella moellendorffii TaxID=88036 RepID=UPI000D1C6275|nr:probable protein phosphatase 2C 32 [Selaginella moellendorffii]|eukprot:XP_024544685.1 probable protein phosphatase 2C 32 [Selaginella moellendorffii]